MYDTILVATDGSDPANRAVEHAIDLAEEYDAEVHAVCIVDTGRYGEPALSSAELVIEELEDEARDLLAAVEDRGARREVVVETACRHGDPDAEILAYAEEVDADLTIMGSHGRSGAGHHIGSVADRVSNRMDRPLLLA